MKSRAAILPYPGDPFLLNYWFWFFDNVWGDEIQKLYVYLNTPAEKDVVDYIRAICAKRPNVSFIYNDIRTDHGICIDRTLDVVTEKYVMLVEDDGFIFKKHIVDNAFSLLESGQYKIVGSKRGSCHPEISERAKQIWGLAYEGEGDQGCNFWPNFFFCETELLKQTDRNFRAKAWKQGEIINDLMDYQVQNEVIHGDTFVNTSLQLRRMIPEAYIYYLPQYHGHPDDLDHYQQQKYLFNGAAFWTHVGSLSSGVSGVLRDEYDRALDRRLIDPPKAQTVLPKEWCQSEAEQKEWERRVQWWQRFIDYFEFENNGGVEITPGMHQYKVLYRQACLRVIVQYNLSASRIAKRRLIYKQLMGN